MANVLVIGGSYFVGRVFVEELAKDGRLSIYVMNRGTRALAMAGVHEIVCDRRDGAKLRRAVPQLEWDAVVDFCAYEPSDVTTLLENLPRRICQYIYISTATVHQNSLLLPMDESTPTITGPLPVPGGDYAYKKWLAEQKVQECCERKGIAHLSLRPSFIYGKYNYAPRESYFFKLIRDGEPITVPILPQALFSMVSVWDLARVCIACLENEKLANAAYIVCSPEMISYDRIIEVLQTITGRELEIKRRPARMIVAQGVPLPFPLEEQLVYSGSRLQGALSFDYMPFLEGMTKTYNWFFAGGTLVSH